MTSQSRAERSQITVRFRARPQSRCGRGRRARPGLAGARQAARRGRRAGDRQGRGRRAADHLSGAVVRTGTSPIDVTDYADRFVKDRLQNLPGVAEVSIFGERALAMRIWLDRAAAGRLRLTAAGRRGRAARARTSRCPAGRIESEHREFTVLSPRPTCGRPSSSTNRDRRDVGGYLVRLKDVGRAEIARARRARRSRASTASRAVTIGVIKQSTANPLDVSNAVQADACRR